ncbi:14803_t:CDS:2, partial [Gigaspora rosea]
KRYRSLPFWRHKDLIPLVQGLEPVEEDETYELEDKLDTDISCKQLNDKTDDELVEALQEYKEGGNDDFFEEFNESWEEVNNCVTNKLQKWIDLLMSQE